MFYGAVKDEAQRLAILEGYQILDTENESDFDDLAFMAATVCQTPIALIVFVDQNRQWFKARIGMEKHETPRAVAFCHHTIQTNSPLIVRDALFDPRFRENPLVTLDPKIRSYAGVPLVTTEGYAIGTICVIDLIPRDLQTEQIHALEALGRLVFSQLELRKRLRNEECLKRDLERRVLERTRELAKSVQEARSASRMKSAFLANMSHEIRTPLGAIMGFADLLKDESVQDGERQAYVDIITRNGEHLQTVLNDILDLSKMEAGYLKTELLSFSPRSIVQDVVTLLSMKAEAKGLWLKTRFPERLPEQVVSDPVRLRQILMNIIGNAIKFTHEGGIEVSVGYEEPGSLRVIVHDTGNGISEEQRDRLFKAFSQADDSMTRKYGGTGLGLALSKRLAELLGGTVTLDESRVGEGSTFSITILDQPRSRLKPSNLSPEPCETPLEHDHLKGTRVLIVDDSADNLNLISRILQKYGAWVETAGNGREGVTKALAHPFDVVLMDLQMPVLDGYSATQQLRARRFLKPIIALTAHALPENRHKCLSLGCTDHLPKPIQPKDLVRTIAKYIPSRELRESRDPTDTHKRT